MTAKHLQPCMTILVALALLGAASAAAQQKKPSNQKKLYCWMQNGIKVCGDALPPEAADAARTEISVRSGLRTRQIARGLTGDERTAAAIAADIGRREGEAEAMRVRRDLAMVESYMTEADLRRAYGERTSLLDASLKASQLAVSNLRLSLLQLLRQAGDQELASKPVPKKLAAAVNKQHGQLRQQQQILSSQRRDRAALEAELVDAVRRYLALKGPRAPEASEAAPATSPAPMPSG